MWFSRAFSTRPSTHHRSFEQGIYRHVSPRQTVQCGGVFWLDVSPYIPIPKLWKKLELGIFPLPWMDQNLCIIVRPQKQALVWIVYTYGAVSGPRRVVRRRGQSFAEKTSHLHARRWRVDSREFRLAFTFTAVMIGSSQDKKTRYSVTGRYNMRAQSAAVSHGEIHDNRTWAISPANQSSPGTP